jgi:Tetratricopeptide repeat
MESYWQLDVACCTAVRRTLISLLIIITVFGECVFAENREAQIRELFRQERWEDLVKLSPALGLSAETDFDYGIALARLGRWTQAEAALRSGLRLQPSDSRFHVELAGVAFQQKDYAKAQSWLQTALHISPRDSYALEFLATVFYLQGNLDAALKFWNRIHKPRLESVVIQPHPRVDAALLDRGFGLSPAGTLKLPELLKTTAQLDNLDIFSSFRFDLQARPEGNFDLIFSNYERNGCGANKWICLVSVFAESPAQTLNFDYFNLGRRAINFRSSFRWDGEKRRVIARLDTPVAGQPKWHLRLSTELRNENWAVRRSFSGPAPPLGALNLKKQAASVQFTDVMSERCRWFAETEYSHREYHNVFSGVVLSPGLLTPGSQLKQSFAIDSKLFRWPERRLNVDSSATLSVARLWSTSSRDFSQLKGTLRFHWFPQHSGEKYELDHTIHAGNTFGTPSFDDLFMIGVLGDTDLQLKAHIATRGGKKGTAPLGRHYFLSNWEATRNFSPISLVKIKAGPWVDTGRMWDSIPGLGSRDWMWDIGIEAKLQAFGFTIVLSYGKDLRSGRNALVAFVP